MFENILNKNRRAIVKVNKKEMVIQRNIESYQRKAQIFQYLEGKKRR